MLFMLPSLSPHLQHIRHTDFVGRQAQCEEFISLLEAPVPRANLIYVHGQAGIGKTTLLREYTFIAESTGIPTYFLDLRDAEPSRDAVLAFLETRTPFVRDATGMRLADDAPQRFVVLLDTCESVGEAGDHVLTKVLPVLPAQALVVAAGRTPGGVALHTDAGWRGVTHWQGLETLEPAEGRALLAARHVPDSAYDNILTFASGHPLALALVADAFEQNPGYQFEPHAAPDVTAALLKRFVEEVPEASQRRALYALGLPPVTDEPLLAAMLAEDDVYIAFEWLRERSFVESTARGLRPHEMVRNVLAADLRWRNPRLFETLHHRARQYYADRLAQPGTDHSRVLADYLFLFRDHPLVKPFMGKLLEGWAGRSLSKSEQLPVQEQDAVRALINRHEGPAAAELAAYWMKAQPEAVHVYCDDDGALSGCLFALRLNRRDLSGANDPAVEAAQRYMEKHAPLRLGETAIHFRFWMSRDHYQGLSPEQCLIFAETVRYYLNTPGLAWTFLPCMNAGLWDVVFRFVGLQRLEEADFQTDDRAQCVYGLDWRGVPPAVWLEQVAGRGLDATQPAPPAPQRTFAVFTREDFGDAVKEVLQHFAQPHLLAHSALLDARLLSAHNNANAAIDALRGWIQKRVEAMQQSPRDAKLARALLATYLDPAPTQERAAEQLDLPFSTYRRHLRAGLEALTDALWNKEISGETL